MDQTLLTNLYNLLFQGLTRYFNSQKEKLVINQPVERDDFFSEENHSAEMDSCQVDEKSTSQPEHSFYCLGVSLMGTAFIGFLLYRLFFVVANIARRRLTVSVHVTGGSVSNIGDRSYELILNWLGNNIKNFPHFTIKIKSRDSYSPCKNDKETEQAVSRLPSYGTHCIQYKGCWILLQRAQTPEVSNYDVSWEALTLTTLKGNEGALNELLLEAKNSEKNDDEDKTAFYYISCGDWCLFGEPKRRRQFDSVIMGSGIKEKLHADIVEFLNSEDWYQERGIPHRRGYLLHGPPGCGKSSFIKAIAGEIGFNICMLSLNAKDLTDDGLNQLMNTAPDKSLILLEDIDAAFKSREAEDVSSKETSLAFEGAGASKVTFRGLLNALDGVASTEGRIIFLTTNYIGRLDPALIRPGRVDFKVLVDLPTEDQLKAMFGRFYPEVSEEQKVQFAKVIKDLNNDVSMAMIQGLFMMNKSDAQAAIDGAKEYFIEQQSFTVEKQAQKETEAKKESTVTESTSEKESQGQS